MERQNSWNIEASEYSKKTLNPIRILWERHQPIANPDKSTIILQSGDPTVFGNFPVHPICYEALTEALLVDTFGYHKSAGLDVAQQAIAEYSRHRGDVKPDDVFLASGGSMAFEMCAKALANPGDNILIPCPAWNYATWLNGTDIESQHYNLLPNDDWKIDLIHLESLINDKTKAILVNNPGNPCGNVFSREHLLEVIKIAERNKLPIIADEIYEFITTTGVEFHSIASLSKNVPVLTVSGTAKRFLMPGARIGWVIVHERDNKLKDIRSALINIAGRNFVPNSTFQLALPRMLGETPPEFFDNLNRTLSKHAKLTFETLRNVPGLKPVLSKGAIYMMVGLELDKFPDFDSSLSFMRHLATEQSVFTLPSEVFYFPGYLRLVLTAPEDILAETCERMRKFCEKHYHRE